MIPLTTYNETWRETIIVHKKIFLCEFSYSKISSYKILHNYRAESLPKSNFSMKKAIRVSFTTSSLLTKMGLFIEVNLNKAVLLILKGL